MWRDLVKRTDVEKDPSKFWKEIVRKLKNREATGENEVTGDENKKKIWR